MITSLGIILPWNDFGEWLVYLGGCGFTAAVWAMAWDTWGKRERQFVSMDEAISYMFAKTNAADIAARAFDGLPINDRRRRTYHYNQIRLMCRQGLLPIYGCRSPSIIIEVIPEDAFWEYEPSDDFTQLVDDESAVYASLCIPRWRLKQATRYIYNVVKVASS